jgi:hypothetical protein
MNNLTFKYPQYSFLHLAEALAKEQSEEQVSKSLCKSDSWYKINKGEYKDFIHNWSGEPLDSVKAHNYYSWMGMSHYYIYTTESRRVLARIMHSGDQIEYFLALNA